MSFFSRSKPPTIPSEYSKTNQSNQASQANELRQYKNKLNYANNILRDINNQNTDIKNLIESRKILKAARKPTVKTFYSRTSSRKKNEARLKQFNTEYPNKIREINKKILNKVRNLPSNQQNNIKTIESDLYNIYKNNNNKRRNLVKILKNKKIQRNNVVIPKYKENKKYNLRVSRLGKGISNGIKYITPESVKSGLSSATKYVSNKSRNSGLTGVASYVADQTGLSYAARGIGKAASLTDKYTGLAASKAVEYSTKAIGTSARSAVNKLSDFGRYTGLNKVTGLDKPSQILSGTKERVKQLKLHVQLLKQQKEEINNKLKDIGESIQEIKNTPNNIENQEKNRLIEKYNELLRAQETLNKNLDEINQQISIIKKKIKQFSGINYNEYSESYENIMSKNSFFNFNLDDEYNKLLLKKNNNKNITIYNNLLTNNKKGSSNSSKLILNNELFEKLFDKDNMFFKKFQKSVPYSEYNFLYGIDKSSKLEEERIVAALYASKILFSFLLEPHLAPVITLIVIGLLMSRFGLNKYRREKSNFKKNIVFCTKYFPFPGIEHFSSELISKYHKIFYYDVYNLSNNQDKNKKFYESVIELTESEENEFIKKNVLFIKYLNNYEKKSYSKLNEDLKAQLSPSMLETLVKDLGKQINQQTNDQMKQLVQQNVQPAVQSQNVQPAVQSQNVKLTVQSQNVQPAVQSQNVKLTVQSQNVPQYNNDENNDLSQYHDPMTNNNLRGGANLSVLQNNRNTKIGDNMIYGKKKLVDKKFTTKFTATNRAVFRLNYKIDQINEVHINNKDTSYILTSGDISIQYLQLELNQIINSRSTFLEGELKPLSHSIPFFTNDYLISLLNKITTYSSSYQAMECTRIFIIDFIKEYIDNFLKLYLLAKYNVLLLLKKPNDISNPNLLLKELFAENLSYTGLGRYKTFITRDPTKEEQYELNQIKYRDMLNYYCILLKYCQSALDHIHKKFKISIIEYDEILYEHNNQCEKELTLKLDERLKSSSFKGYGTKIFNTTNKDLNPYTNNNNKGFESLSQKIVDVKNYLYKPTSVPTQRSRVGSKPSNVPYINLSFVSNPYLASATGSATRSAIGVASETGSATGSAIGSALTSGNVLSSIGSGIGSGITSLFS